MTCACVAPAAKEEKQVKLEASHPSRRRYLVLVPSISFAVPQRLRFLATLPGLSPTQMPRGSSPSLILFAFSYSSLLSQALPEQYRVHAAVVQSRLQAINPAHLEVWMRRYEDTRICSLLLLGRPSDIFHPCAPLFCPMRFACSHPTDRRERGQNVAWKWSHTALGASVSTNLDTRDRHCSVMNLPRTHQQTPSHLLTWSQQVPLAGVLA